MLLSALRPDHGHVTLPGHPDGKEPNCDVGWITYFSHAELPSPPDLYPPAMRALTEDGTKIFATPALAVERHADVAAAISRVRAAGPILISPRLASERFGIVFNPFQRQQRFAARCGETGQSNVERSSQWTTTRDAAL